MLDNNNQHNIDINKKAEWDQYFFNCT